MFILCTLIKNKFWIARETLSLSFFGNVINYMMQNLNLRYSCMDIYIYIYIYVCMYIMIKYAIDKIDG